MTARLTIVTGTRNRPESLKRLLISICASSTINTDILIADASDEFHGAPDLPNYGDYVVNVDAYHESPRLFPNQGYDQLCRKATTEYVLFMNDDAEMTFGCDKIAVDFMDANQDVGIGCLYWCDPNGQKYLQSFQNLQYANFGIIRKAHADISGWFDTREVFIPELNRKERLTFYGCDVGVSFKMIDAGFGVVGIPESFVKHHREQDAERHANNQMFVHGNEGQIAGTVLYHLWGGLAGYAELRKKHEKFKHLHVPENPLQGLGDGR